MMLYVFVQDPSGNVEAVGVDTEFNEAVQAAVKPFSEKGCQLSSLEAYSQQTVGAVNKQLEAADAKIAAAKAALEGSQA